MYVHWGSPLYMYTVLNIRTYLIAVDRSVATVGRVSIVLRSATILHCVSLTTLQSDRNNFSFLQ